MSGTTATSATTSPMRPAEVAFGVFPETRLAAALAPTARAPLHDHLTQLAGLLRGRVLWNVNSTAAGGGVSEMLHSFLPYLRGAGIDSRWAVIRGTPEFFEVTKRLHHLVHGEPGDGGELGEQERALYEATSDANALGLADVVRSGDVVLLHDPQTAGMAAAFHRAGAHVVWRSHIGTDEHNAHVERAWDFLRPSVRHADALVFSRAAYAPPGLDVPTLVIQPSIDPNGPKNGDMELALAHTILDHVGLARSGIRDGPRVAFRRQDGSPVRIEHGAEVLRTGPPPPLGHEPLVVQVSRWDRLKDPQGVVRGFVDHVLPRTRAHLILAGPTVHSVADDPEAADVLLEVMGLWKSLPHAARRRVQLACLPMRDLDENAAIVNALQRSADVVVQKSVREGFGLTVAEAMWKSRPVVASRVGGMADQIEDGRSGVLVADPHDLAAFGAAVSGLLADPEAARIMGGRAREHVRAQFLHDRQIADHLRLVSTLLEPGRGAVA